MIISVNSNYKHFLLIIIQKIINNINFYSEKNKKN